MKEDIEEKIKAFCKKSNMKIDKLSINTTEKGYVATDGYTSIMFDKKGKISSLPMHKLYGNNMTSFVGSGLSIYLYVIATLFIVGIIYKILK
ncbi:hypothetical protein CLPUN_42470 [Clostridium puniceum]|uniref:Uncharacterized protein n=1 Tax=Clostridium puniceum TaxID=29367 RepID=A0A1S8T8B0_9CLOT|nr:hypothetical protein [Clostridium puniceum]OOM73892.1 hypothetical protein CLPUN_42470 [Clostridium puniceum]